jgi:hypothetical protein
MNDTGPTVSEGKKEASKTYLEQTKLLVTLSSAFLFAPAGLSLLGLLLLRFFSLPPSCRVTSRLAALQVRKIEAISIYFGLRRESFHWCSSAVTFLASWSLSFSQSRL